MLIPRRPLEIFVVAVGDYKTGNSGIVEIASLDRKYHVFRFTDTSCFFDVTKLAFLSQLLPRNMPSKLIISGFVKIPSLKIFFISKIVV